MKKILALLLVALLAFTMIACNKEEEEDNAGQIENLGATNELIYNDFKYAVNEDGGYEIVGYVFGGVELLDIEVPAKIDDRAVTGIGADAFKGAKNVKSIKLPDGLLYIDNYAFYDCDYITEIVIPDSVTTIGQGAFQGCDALASVTFSKNLVRIYDFAFQGCPKLANFTLYEGLVSIGTGAFDGCATLTDVVIPSTVINLGDTAFYGCSNLQSVTADIVVSEADQAIVVKMNEILAQYQAEKEQKPATAADAFAVLEEAGLYVGGETANGVKYVWDQKGNQIIGAFCAADADLVSKLNAALKNAKSTPEDIYKLEALFTAAGLSLDNLNTVIDGSKYHWNAQTNRMELTYTVGECVFHGAKDGLTVYTVVGSPMDAYASNYHTVQPMPVSDEAEA